jgi:uncharacterized protein YdaT
MLKSANELENEPQDPIDQEIEQTDPVEGEGEGVVQPASTTPNPEEEEVEIAISGVEAPKRFDVDAKETTPEWVNNLRREYRDLVKENNTLTKELGNATARIAELERKTQQADPEIQVMEKPTLEGCEFDTDVYDEQMEAWRQNQQQLQAKKQKKQQAEQAENEAWNKKLSDYQAKRNALKVSNYQEAEDRVRQQLDTMQQSIVIKAASDSAVVVYALGKNQKILDELSQIKDPIDFSVAVARLESKLTVTAKTRQAPPPEQKVVRGGGLTGDAELARLEAQAEQSGDRTAVIAYKRQLRRQA